MDYHLIRGENFSKLRNSIKTVKSENKIPLVVSDSYEITRKLFEKEKGIIVAPLLKNRQDKLYYRDSGFDLPTARFAVKNKNVLGIVADDFLNERKKIKSIILARIRQNVKLAKKTGLKVRFVFLNPEIRKDKHDLFSLGLMIGMDTKTAKLASQ